LVRVGRFVSTHFLAASLSIDLRKTRMATIAPGQVNAGCRGEWATRYGPSSIQVTNCRYRQESGQAPVGDRMPFRRVLAPVIAIIALQQ